MLIINTHNVTIVIYTFNYVLYYTFKAYKTVYTVYDSYVYYCYLFPYKLYYMPRAYMLDTYVVLYGSECNELCLLYSGIGKVLYTYYHTNNSILTRYTPYV